MSVAILTAHRSFAAGELIDGPSCEQLDHIASTVADNDVTVSQAETWHSASAFNCLIFGAQRCVARGDIASGERLFVNFDQFASTVVVRDAGEKEAERLPRGFDALDEKEKQALAPIVTDDVLRNAVAAGFEPLEGNSSIRLESDSNIAARWRLYAVAATDIPNRRVLATCPGVKLPFPVAGSIALSATEHLLISGAALFLDHSCTPNVRVFVQPRDNTCDIIALRDIRAGERLTYNYLTTEWDMAEPFRCKCGASNCMGMIRGFANLTTTQQQSMLHLISPAVLARLHPPARSPSRSLRPTAATCDAVFDCISTEATHITHAKRGDILFENVNTDDLVIGATPDTCFMRVAGRQLRHSTTPSTVFVEGRLIAMQDMTPTTELTIDMRLLRYRMPAPLGGFVALTRAEQDALVLYTEPALRAEASVEGFTVGSSSPRAAIRRNGGMGEASFTACAVTTGEAVFSIRGLILPFPTMYTICMTPESHLLFAGGAQCLAHSCDPNVKIVVHADREGFDAIALRDIPEGELVSFNYLTTEWLMQAPFRCLCGAPRCFGEISGFSQQPADCQADLLPECSPAVQELVRRREVELARIGAAKRGDILFENVNTDDLVIGATPDTCFMRVAGRQLRHSTTPSTVFVEGRLVAMQDMTPTTDLTIDMRLLRYRMPAPLGGFVALTRAEQDALVLYTEPALRAEASVEGFTVGSSSPRAAIRRNGGMGEASFTACAVTTGEAVFSIRGLILPFPTMYTICMTPESHLLFAGGAQCLAHSCDPNVKIVVHADREGFDAVALRDIPEGELVSFNYLTTEWLMQAPFRCLCGAPRCFGEISGFSQQPAGCQADLLPECSPAVQELVRRCEVELARIGAARRGDLLFENVNTDDLVIGATPDTCFMRVAGRQLRHSTTPSTVFVEGRLVAMQDMTPTTELTIDMRLLRYRMPAPLGGFAALTRAEQDELMLFCEPEVRRQAAADGYSVGSRSALVDIRPNGGMGEAGFAACAIETGTPLFSCRGLVMPVRTMYTICMAPGRHLLFGEGAQCLAHSCDPNVEVRIHGDKQGFDFVALRPIADGELVSFNYLTTEWEMTGPFDCLCGTPECFQRIEGLARQPAERREKLLPRCSPAVQELARIGAARRGDLLFENVNTDDLVIGATPDTCFMRAAGRQLRHSTTPSTVFVEGRLVAMQDMTPTTELTIDMRLLRYRMPAPLGGFATLTRAEQDELMLFCEPEVRRQAAADGYSVGSRSALVDIRPNGGMGEAGFAACAIETGTPLFSCRGLVMPVRTMYTICMAPGRHLLFGEGAQCLAHSCDPNVEVRIHGDKQGFDFVALRPIADGELVSFNYLTTEWEMTGPFDCLCGAPECFQRIEGLARQPAERREKLLPRCSPAVQELARRS
jgi:SET domain-containing protein